MTGRGKLTRKGMQGEIHRSESPKVFPDTPKYTEDSRKTGFRERDRWLGSEFGEWVLTATNVEFKVCFHKWQGNAQGRRMIIELRNIHAMWELLIENTCMLLAYGNVTMWIGTGVGEHGCVTNKGKTNYMDGIDVAKQNGRVTAAVKSVSPRTDLVSSTKPILPMEPSYQLDPALWPGL
jgi:hypothetical protein